MNARDLAQFESGIKDLWEAGDLPSLVHLCGGNENRLTEIFGRCIKPGDWIFSTHRTHFHALLAGIDPEALRQKIIQGDSMFVYSRVHNFFCSAILAGSAGIAAGVAWQLKEEQSASKVLCFIGDGGEEEGHFYEAAMFVEANDLPCRFIIEDNNRSVDTPREYRRGMAQGLENLFDCVERYYYEPTYPHAGSGCTFKIEFKQSAIESHLRQ